MLSPVYRGIGFQLFGLSCPELEAPKYVSEVFAELADEGVARRVSRQGLIIALQHLRREGEFEFAAQGFSYPHPHNLLE